MGILFIKVLLVLLYNVLESSYKSVFYAMEVFNTFLFDDFFGCNFIYLIRKGLHRGLSFRHSSPRPQLWEYFIVPYFIIDPCDDQEGVTVASVSACVLLGVDWGCVNVDKHLVRVLSKNVFFYEDT